MLPDFDFFFGGPALLSFSTPPVAEAEELFSLLHLLPFSLLGSGLFFVMEVQPSAPLSGLGVSISSILLGNASTSGGAKSLVISLGKSSGTRPNSEANNERRTS
jgi:hypothetical protein